MPVQQTPGAVTPGRQTQRHPTLRGTAHGHMPGSLCQPVARRQCWGQAGRGLGPAGRQSLFVGGGAAAHPGVTGTMGDCTQHCTHTHWHVHGFHAQRDQSLIVPLGGLWNG